MPRHLCSELVAVAWGDYEGHGNLEEIGEWTALVLVEDFVPRDTKLRIQCQGHELKGLVEAYEFEAPLGFFVEVRLDPDSRWSEKWFTPQHLLAFQGEPVPKVFPLAMASGY
jgi:hypothetical protein